MKHVVISILNYNHAEITKACLESLNQLKQTDLKVEVVVVDNASEEKFTFDSKQYPHLKIHLVTNSKNTGFSGGHNKAIKYVLEKNADYVIILNNDTTVDKNLLVNLLQNDENEKIGIIAPKIYFSKGSEYHKDRYKPDELGKVIWYAGGIIDWANVYWKHRGVDEVDYGQFDNTEQTQFASGCCMAIKKEVLKTVGGFDDKFFLYYEDSDLCERVKRAGFSILYAPSAFLWHQNAGSTGGSGSSLQDYFTTRNRLLLGFRYATNRAKLSLLREAIRISRTGREWQKKGVADFFKGKFGKGSYPV